MRSAPIERVGGPRERPAVVQLRHVVGRHPDLDESPAVPVAQAGPTLTTWQPARFVTRGARRSRSVGASGDGSSGNPRNATSAGIDASTMTVADPSTSRYELLLVFVLAPEPTGRSCRARAREGRQRPARRAARASTVNDILFHAMPRLFLIDGSSQMYRAYHAIRGLTGPDGRSTNAVYGFVDDAAQADRRPRSRSSSRRRSIWPARRSATSSPPTTRPTARRCRPTWPSRCRSCTRPARRWACPSSPPSGFEADDVIGTLAAQARGGRASTWPSSRATRTSSSSSTTASASTTRGTRAPGTTRPASSRSSASGRTRSWTCWR